MELGSSAECGALARLGECGQLESNQHGRRILKIGRLLAANFVLTERAVAEGWKESCFWIVGQPGGLSVIFGFSFRGWRKDSLFARKLAEGCCCTGGFLFARIQMVVY